ncbi:DedA family protein [Rubellimicrobium sp. CFH 75288]|uniref:DedA family protein n=1 Tax=Rubellimicrobium sp. CFH 75288 TaxID=2697034 RepID=UPI001412BA37|nr:DedA family protein [Rubellimicrobium sp. CFH 75288]NAZ35927.1 DedA family protein [Rubellimicrobium sp. CFH 75288]
MFDFITNWMEQGGLLAVAGLMLLENLFPPIPSELVMPLAGYLAATGAMGLVAVIVAGTFGAVLGALFWYGLARSWGELRFMRFVDRWGFLLTITPDEARRAVLWFRRYGAAAVFLGRMVPTVRTLISIPAGIVAMPLLPFLLYTAAGASIWTAGLAVAGWLLGSQYALVEDYVDPFAALVLFVAAVVYVYRVGRALWLRRRAR